MKAARDIKILLSILVTVLFTSHSVAEPIEISIGVSLEFAADIDQAMEQHPNVCEQDDFFSSDWHRTVFEFFIVCRAIRIGGLDATYSFTNYPNSARALSEIKKGSFMIMVDLPWAKYSQDESLYQSSAVLRVGEFVKGIYTRPDQKALLNVKTLEELRKFTAVSNKIWFYDWAALERMNLEKISVPKYTQMGRMVAGSKADFFVGEFPGTDDLSLYVDGVKFVPVPNLKILLRGSRHIAVSKRFLHSKQVFNAIVVGLKSLQDRGLINQGYRTVGMFNPLVEDWKVICCE